MQVHPQQIAWGTGWGATHPPVFYRPHAPFIYFCCWFMSFIFSYFFVYFTFSLSLENEGLKEGAQNTDPLKMGDRRWEEHLAGAESGSKYDRMMWESGAQQFPPVGPFPNSVLTKYFLASNWVSWCRNGTCLHPQPTEGPWCWVPISANCGVWFRPITGHKSAHHPLKPLTI